MFKRKHLSLLFDFRIQQICFETRSHGFLPYNFITFIHLTSNQPFKIYIYTYYLSFWTYTGTPVAALTGTADAKTQKIIKDSLKLKVDVKSVYVGPNRRNLRFSVRKAKIRSNLRSSNGLLNLTKGKGLETPKTIIFYNTMNEIASIVNYLLCKLDCDAYSERL